MKLNDLRDNPGARKKRMIIGRGIGSGKGKTGGRGVKGQKARTGVALGGFSGGQMPLIRRLPKRGFKNIFAKDYAAVNLGRLQTAIDDGRVDIKKPITSESLIACGVACKARDGVRLIGKGELKAKIDISVAGASKTAIDAVEKAGGKITLTAPKKEAEEKAA
ncbi:MAG: 50S ribosomal protein L15 [Alphaproteobacteria bacterium]|nr:50S ribosomal protein L15 [Alphaproteobacteria bacterium]